MKNILITSLGSTTAITAMKLLDDKLVNLIGTDCLEAWEIASSDFVDEFYQIPHCKNEKEYINSLKDIVKKERIDIIIPIYDKEIEVLSKPDNRNQFKCGILCSPHDTVMRCNDKWETYEMFKKCGIPTPETKKVGMHVAWSDAIFKPRFGVGSKGIIHDPQAFNKKVPAEYVSQEFIHGDEYTIDFCVNLYRNLLYCVPRKRIRIADGISAKAETVDNKLFLPYIKQLTKHVKFWGPINIQCIVKDEKPWFFEINPRLGASSIITKRAGIDIGEYILRMYDPEDLAIQGVDNNYKKIRMNRYIMETFYDI